ncbi:MAG: hypothetical protein QXH21_09380 [Ignisphaera sp.]
MYSYYVDYEKYLRIDNPKIYMSFVAHYNLDDFNYIPRSREVNDANPKTSSYTMVYLSREVEVLPVPLR